jgi:predicted nucleic acid-binding Zn ribbon protein
MELFQAFNDSTVPIHCGQEMSRMFSTPGIILKGTGWGKDK